MSTLTIAAQYDNIPKAVDFVEEKLKKHKVSIRDTKRAMLLTEEIIVNLIKNCEIENDIIVNVRRVLGALSVKICAKGLELKQDMSITEINGKIDCENLDEDARYVVNNLLLNAYNDNISSKYINGCNYITIVPKTSSQSNLKRCILAILLATVVGAILRFVAPSSVADFILNNILTPVSTILMNALKLITTPLVFFSLVACVSSFTDLRFLGKISIKIAMFYTFTTFLAIIVGTIIIRIFGRIEPNSLVQFVDSITKMNASEISIINTIVDIVPSNLVVSFAESNTLQVLFAAILIGIAVTKMGKNSTRVAHFFECGNDLFLSIASIITKALPIIIFVTFCSLIIKLDFESGSVFGSVVGMVILGNFTMLLVYCILVAVVAGKNPINYAKHTVAVWLNAFTLSSSNASMPVTMEVCDKKLHISPKVYSFSIPLGATINMDGGATMMTIVIQALAIGFGITFTPSEYISLFISIVLMSMAVPGLPGAALMLLTMLAEQFGIPTEGIALFAGFYMLLDPFNTASNVCGDVAGTYIIAVRNNLILKKDAK